MSNEQLIKSVQDVNEAVTALRLLNEQKGIESKTAFQEIQTALDAYEKKNQELLTRLATKDSEIKAIEEKLIAITSPANYNNANAEVKTEVKAYEDFLAGKNIVANI